MAILRWTEPNNSYDRTVFDWFALAQTGPKGPLPAEAL
jgi:hypothetical protein